MGITALGLTAFSSGIGAACAVLALMSAYSATTRILGDID